MIKHVCYTLIGLAFFAPVASQASYELLLAASITDNKIHRYDGDTGAYLGSFGSGLQYSWGVIADQPRNIAYVTGGERVFKYNYNTGELVGSFAYTLGGDRWAAINAAGTEFYAPGSGAITVLNSTTGATIRTISRAAFNARSVTTIANNVIMVFGTEAGNVVAHTFNTSTGALIQTASLGAGNFALQSAILGGTNSVVAHIVDSDGSTEVARVGFTASGALTGSAIQTINPYYTALDEGGWGMATSHTGVWMTGAYDTTDAATPEFRRYVGAPLVQERLYRPAQKHIFTSFATVLAPEPSVMIGLGMGVVALIRRKPRK